MKYRIEDLSMIDSPQSADWAVLHVEAVEKKISPSWDMARLNMEVLPQTEISQLLSETKRSIPPSRVVDTELDVGTRDEPCEWEVLPLDAQHVLRPPSASQTIPEMRSTGLRGILDLNPSLSSLTSVPLLPPTQVGHAQHRALSEGMFTEM